MVRRRQLRSQAGFTLIELVIVLFILAGLAGILVPFSNTFVQRTHGSTGASNIEEITKGVTRFQAEFFTSPNNWESLVVTGGGGLYSFLANGAGELTAAALGGTAAASLVDAGITAIIPMTGTVTNLSATFDSTVGMTPVAPAAAVQAAFVAGAAIAREFTNAPADPDGDGNPDNDYVAFGLGPNNSMVNRVMVTAPVHTLEAGNPGTVYARWLAIYQVAGVESARFIGVVATDDDGIVGLGGHLAEYYAAGN
ncbi:MAG: type II secretion system protein [Candidatus Tectimicrobiota bacterium]